jgi:hypothetical protein
LVSDRNVMAGHSREDPAGFALAYTLNYFARGSYHVLADDQRRGASFFHWKGGWVVHRRDWAERCLPLEIANMAAAILAGEGVRVTQAHAQAIAQAARTSYEFDRRTR